MPILLTMAAVITRVLKHAANVPDPTTGNSAGLRTRTLEQAQEGLATEVWLDEDGFTWTRADGTVTIAGQAGPLPEDFREVGADGSVWSAAGVQLSWVPPWRMQQIQQGAESVGLTCYSIFGQETDTSATPQTSRQLLQVPPGFSGQVVTLRAYKKQVPELLDNDSASGLEGLPADAIYAWLLPYLRFRVFDDRNDQRAYIWEKKADASKKRLKANDRGGKDTPQQFVGWDDDYWEEDL